jgi:drug/metabolite transporter (DMT)-like permease
MLAVIFGFSGALVFGCADFLGGLASRRLNPYVVTGLAGFSGLIGVSLIALLTGGEISLEAITWGALSGLAGSIAIAMLYAALAIGPMSILSPLGALVSAAVPVTWAALRGTQLAPLAYLAIAMGLIAIVLVGFVPEKNAVRPSAKGLALSVGSGVGIGLFMICIDQAPTDAGLVPLVANRAVTTLVLAAIIGILVLRGKASSPVTDSMLSWRAALWIALGTGLVDTTANGLLIAGFQTGELSVMSVLTAMYPAGTVILAAVFLKERVAPWQAIGLVLAIAAAGLLALS